MKVNHPKVCVAVGNHQLGNAVFLHFFECFDCQFVTADCFRILCHNVRCFRLVDVGVFLKHSSEVAVGYDSDELIVVVNHGGCAKSFRRNFNNHFGN